MTIYIDIDGTICNTEGMDYEHAQPILRRIAMINRAYDAGHHIVMWTARGAASGNPPEQLTRKQLSDWRVKYHDLSFDKPIFDMLIDDKAHCARKLDET